ncbi:MAG: hypothetical protein AAGI52_10955 [Bacteroidota bacterium]
MRLALLALAFLLLAPASAAQEDSGQEGSGFDRLSLEIRKRLDADALFSRQLDAAYTDAIRSSRYARADSIAVLARLSSVDDFGLPYDSLAWPSPADALALRFLRGDPAALDWIAEDGRWWGGFLTYDGEALIEYSPGDVHATAAIRPASQVALNRDREQILDLLREAGATAEDEAAVRLALSRLGGGHVWRDPVYTLISGQDALNDTADAFLAQYPDSRYERYVRREVRHRFRLVSRYAIHGGIGAGAGDGGLGSETKAGGGAALAVGVRAPWWHADLGFRGTALPIRESIVRSGGELVESEAIGVWILGVSTGPRIATEFFEVMPYVTGGFRAQDISVSFLEDAEDVERLSTYDPPNGLSWGYGLGLEFPLVAEEDESMRIGLRIDVGRLHTQFDGGFEDLLAGGITTATVGLTLTEFLMRRQP